MVNPIAASSVRAIDPRGAMTNITKETPESTKPAAKTKTLGQMVDETVAKPEELIGPGAKVDANESPHGALTKFREGRREFAFGVLRPKSGLVGEKAYETSFSQTMENLSQKHNGALTGFYNKVHGFAFGIMRPESGVIGEETYDSSNSMTIENLSKEHIGAAAGIRDTLHQYAKSARESVGATVKIAEPTQVLKQEFRDTPAGDTAQNTQHVDMTI